MKFAITITVLALLTITNLSFLSAVPAQAGAAKEVPFTLEDRDRLIRLETKVEGLDKRIDGLQNLMYIVIGAIIAQTIGIVGFTLWNRRSALAPAIKKNKELEERQDKIERVIKEVALKNSDIAEALKRVGL